MTAVLRTEARRGLGLYQRTIDREMLVRQQRLDLRMVEQPRHELLEHLAGLQPFTVLGEGRRVPYRVVRRQSDKPAIQQVVATVAPSVVVPSGRHTALGSTKRSAVAPVALMAARPWRRAWQSAGSALSTHRGRSILLLVVGQGIFQQTAMPVPTVTGTLLMRAVLKNASQ